MSTCLFMIKIRHLAYTCCHCLFFSTLDCVFFGLIADLGPNELEVKKHAHAIHEHAPIFSIQSLICHSI